jgi:hemolysin type calcium-binding protein
LSDNQGGVSTPLDPDQQKGRFGVRRIVLLVAAAALALSLAASVALAQPFGDSGRGVTKTCGAHCQGTTYPDTLTGTSAPNHIEGRGGNESVTFGDLIRGRGGNDVLYGNRGGDRIEGGSGKDVIFGGQGEDLLIGGTGRDHINGGTGGDIIRVRDGFRDIVNCEGGSDNVQNRDSFDVLHEC